MFFRLDIAAAAASVPSQGKKVIHTVNNRLTRGRLCVIFIPVRESISKALLLTDATSANGEETRDVCISVALKF